MKSFSVLTIIFSSGVEKCISTLSKIRLLSAQDAFLASRHQGDPTLLLNASESPQIHVGDIL